MSHAESNTVSFKPESFQLERPTMYDCQNVHPHCHSLHRRCRLGRGPEQRQAGDKVIIRTTELLAITVKKP